MKLDSDPIVREVGDRIDPLNGERLRMIGILGNNWKRIKDEQMIKLETIIGTNHCTIIEVTCPYEISKVCLQQQEEEKVAKYKKLIQVKYPLLLEIWALYQRERTIN